MDNELQESVWAGITLWCHLGGRVWRGPYGWMSISTLTGLKCLEQDMVHPWEIPAAQCVSKRLGCSFSCTYTRSSQAPSLSTTTCSWYFLCVLLACARTWRS